MHIICLENNSKSKGDKLKKENNTNKIENRSARVLNQEMTPCRKLKKSP